MHNKPIGVFDSGIGGLTVVKEIARLLPRERIVYFGDTARVPYGVKSKETIVKFSIENTLFLLQKDVKMIVVACNTSSSLALPEIRRHFKVPMMGVIGPGAKEAVYATKSGRVGVIGTRATVNSGAYEAEIRRLDPSVKVFAEACPMFVPIVEEGWVGDPVAGKVAERYLAPMKARQIDTLILGCTHYPLLKPLIHRIMGPGVRLIDSAQQVAAEVRQVLVQEGILCRRNGRTRHEYYVSDEVAIFANVAKRFLGRELTGVRRMSYV
ncbi:MAG: glutamate racemase [Deltaproteobacteria bacterium]